MSTELASQTIVGENSELTQSGSDGAERMTLDDVFHVLQNGRRRDAIEYILARPEQETFEMSDIAEQVAAWENDKPVAQITSAERQRVYIALYQTHLPKLDAKGVIEYEQNRGTVRPTARLEYVGRFLSPMTETSDAANADTGIATRLRRRSPFSYYTGATLLGLLLVSASWIGATPAVLTSYLAAFVTGLFAVVTIATKYLERFSP